MIGDLHCHTRLSDGSMSIDDLIFYARRAGLDFIAITDHDTMEGVTRAAVLGKRYGINVVAGTEISCYDRQRGRKVHILCYLPDKPDRLQGLFGQILDSRTRTGQRIIHSVMRYYPVTEEHIQRYTMGSKSIYKSHIMQALLDLGYDDRIYGEVYERLFGEQGLCRRSPEYPSVHDVLDQVSSAGGISVLAHPAKYGSMDLLEELAVKGAIQGVEAYHPSAQPELTREIEQLADDCGLLKTGGSDFHGVTDRKPRPLASHITSGEGLTALYHCKRNLGTQKK